jgi:hypothetical protein
MATHRYRAPTTNGAVLAEPGFDALPALVGANRKRLDRTDVVIGGLPLRELRALARREVLELACEETESPALRAGLSSSGPLVLAGHQPELSHPGVWVKNFALSGLARKLGGVPLHLVVDTDTLKSTSLRFPTFRERDPHSVRLKSVAFDAVGGKVPYADRTVRDVEMFRTFAERAAPLWANWGYEPLLAKRWMSGKRVGEAFVTMRGACEREWGCHNLELPVSLLFWCEAYTRFVAHVLLDLPRFAEVYNRAVRAYRKANGIRSTNHPAPELECRAEDVEAPFWLVWYGQDRRTRFYVRREGDQLRFTTGARIATNLAQFVRAWAEFSESGTLIHPRALTLTLFARVCLGDFFIHGIGGGKYDEVTDAIIRDYFGIEPPAYQVLSATLHLPLPSFPSTPDGLHRAGRLVRDLRWNPQRYLSAEQLANPDAKALVDEHETLTAHEPPDADRAARREWFRALHTVTTRLRALVAAQVPGAEARLERVQSEVSANAILRRRDYAWVLYPEEVLRPFLQSFCA